MESNDFRWIVSLLLRISDRENQTKDEHKRIQDAYPYLSWSPYDRMDIVKIEKFSSFFQNPFQINVKLEVKQMHLIPKYPTEFCWEINGQANKSVDGSELPDRENCMIRVYREENGNLNKICFGLNCVIAVRFEPDWNRSQTVELCDEIQHKVQAELAAGQEMDWAAFDSLGAEDIVFIVLANDIITIGKFLDIVKNCKYKSGDGTKDICKFVNSISGFNDSSWMERKDMCNIANLGADIHIHLTLKSNGVWNEIEKALNGKGNYSVPMLGKAVDIEIKDSSAIYSLYSRDGVLNGESKLYYKNIQNSQSYWCFDEAEVKTAPIV